MLHIKSINFTPQVLICYALLIGGICLTAIKQGNSDTVSFQKQQIPADEISGKHSYQLQIVTDQFNKQTGYDVLLMDGSRMVTVIRLDSTCNLTKAIEEDNQ